MATNWKPRAALRYLQDSKVYPMATLCSLAAVLIASYADRSARGLGVGVAWTSSSADPSQLNVLDFGVLRNDNTSDSTTGFQSALNAAVTQKVFRVYAPAGMYYFRASIAIPVGVTLAGSYDSVPSHDLRAGARLDDGTVLVPLGGRGSEGGTPFITVPVNAVAKGFVVWYAEQERTASPGACKTPYSGAVCVCTYVRMHVRMWYSSDAAPATVPSDGSPSRRPHGIPPRMA